MDKGQRQKNKKRYFVRLTFELAAFPDLTFNMD